jgi:hypothetical protein
MKANNSLHRNIPRGIILSKLYQIPGTSLRQQNYRSIELHYNSKAEYATAVLDKLVTATHLTRP